ncbi:MAG: GPW/gp25 family protein [Vogesella sp.]|uniref:GPW/gp25 family protein n=1 Tax=Vogesella sp. TaxID=1904252 RepID=UPI0039192C32
MMDDIIGMDIATGRTISGLEHIQQSCGVILNTAIGTRVERREFGSLVPVLLDRPLNGKTRMQLLAATAIALRTWEPRITIAGMNLAISTTRHGAATIELDTMRATGPTAGQRGRINVEVGT